MLTLTRSLAIAAMGLALLAMTAASAEAGKKYRYNKGANFAAGVATGLIIGGIVAGSQRRGGSYYCINGYCNGGRYYGPRRYYPSRYYYRPAPRYYYQRPAKRYYRKAPRYRVSASQAHTNYCFAKYRSYRAYDNTFQPYHGPRKQCRSPYF